MNFSQIFNCIDISSFLSAVVGGLFVLVGTVWAHCLRTKKEDEREINKKQHILKAINTEANVLTEVFKDLLEGIKNNRDDKRFNYPLRDIQNYFSTYDLNSNTVGAISDEKYRASIIEFHLFTKRLIDALLANNIMLEKSSEFVKNFCMTGDERFKNFYSANECDLVINAKFIKKLVSQIEEKIKNYNDLHKKYVDT